MVNEAPHIELDKVFDRHLSRNFENISRALNQSGIDSETFKMWIAAGWVKVLDFGHGKPYRHFERTVFPK